MPARWWLEGLDPLLLSLWCMCDVLFSESVIEVLRHVFNVLVRRWSVMGCM